MTNTRTAGIARARKALGGLAAAALLALPSSAGADDDLFCWSEAPVFAEGRVSLRHKAAIAGLDGAPTHVVSNGVVRMVHHASIDGDVTAPRVRRWGRTNVSGDVMIEPAGESPPAVHDLVESYRFDNDNHLIPQTEKGRDALIGQHLLVRKRDHLVLPEGDYFLDSLRVRRGGVLELEGRVRIFMDRGWVTVRRGSLVGADSGDLGLFIAGSGIVHVGGRSEFHAAVYAPESRFVLRGRGSASGSLVVRGMHVADRAKFLAEDTCVPAQPPEPEIPPTEPPDRPPRPGTTDATDPATDPTVDGSTDPAPEDEFARAPRPGS